MPEFNHFFSTFQLVDLDLYLVDKKNNHVLKDNVHLVDISYSIDNGKPEIELRLTCNGDFMMHDITPFIPIDIETDEIIKLFKE